MSALTFAETTATQTRACDVLDMSSRDNPTILSIAHRGLWRTTAENSLASIRAAAAAGVDIVEIDTQSSHDGRLVVIHDETLDRTTTGKGTVSQLSFAAIRQARLLSGAGGEGSTMTDERVPTLEEILEEARGRVAINIDTKFTRDLPQVMATLLRLNVADQVVVKTNVDLEARHFSVLDEAWFGKIPHMPMFSVRAGRFVDDLKRIETLQPPMIEVKFQNLQDIALARPELERQNIRIWINTLDVSHSLDFNDSRALSDPHGVWTVLADAGVGAIQTDEVEAFLAWRASRR